MSKNTRSRFGAPRPYKRVDIQQSDIEIFGWIHRHGHLPVHFLYELTKKKSYKNHQRRMTKLYNGWVMNIESLKRRVKIVDDTGEISYQTHSQGDPVRYLDKLENQKELRDIFQKLVYDLAPHAIEILKENDAFSPFISHDDHFLHRLFRACVGSSIEFFCAAKGLTYLSRHSILKPSGKKLQLPVKYGDQEYLKPDDLFGIQYGTLGKRRFAVEIDRASETQQGQIFQKMRCYEEIMRNRTYHSEWGIPGLVVLFVTTSNTRADNMKKHIKGSEFADRFKFKVIKDFAKPWKMPQGLYTDILENWTSVDGTRFDLSKP